MTIPQHVIDAIIAELAHQSAKYGTPQERRLPLGEYVRILYAELREVKVSLDEGDQDAALCELAQVVAVGIACMMFHGSVTRAELEKRTLT